MAGRAEVQRGRLVTRNRRLAQMHPRMHVMFTVHAELAFKFLPPLCSFSSIAYCSGASTQNFNIVRSCCQKEQVHLPP